MGILDFFRRGNDTPTTADGKPVDRKFANLAKTAANKRSQPYEREEAMQALIDLGTVDAAEALLKRFTLQVDPSITDQEEKQFAFDGVVRIGTGDMRDAVVERIRGYCSRANNLNWALKVLRDLLDDRDYQAQLLTILGTFDTEYTRNVEPKVNLLAALESVPSDTVRQAVEPYLNDVNETVRFHAVQTLFEHADPASLPALLTLVNEEESVRIKNKVAAGMLACDWAAPAEQLEAFRASMADVHEYRITASGGIESA